MLLLDDPGSRCKYPKGTLSFFGLGRLAELEESAE